MFKLPRQGEVQSAANILVSPTHHHLSCGLAVCDAMQAILCSAFLTREWVSTFSNP